MSDLIISDLLILLVEPSTTQRKYISNYLTELGIQSIDYADTGAEALASMDSVVPDLVISAMHLADMTGTDLILRMRDNETLLSVPFMLISSETHYRYLEPIRQAGVIAILPKPFEFEQLHAALNSTLNFISPESQIEDTFKPEEVVVLLVDDSRLARKHISRVLRNMGIEHILEAENGLEGIEILNKHVFDLIITDYNMPEMDGKAFSQYVREQSDQNDLPIVMVTSVSDSSRLAMVENIGVSAICDKPFDAADVRELLISLLPGARN
ncbi:MAG TPA: response regulator [Gammaproteobacteria bacterium]|nr:response regulator [Gammaproteobacteria bacterium]